MSDPIDAYNDAQPPEAREVCRALARHLRAGLPRAEGKLWHGGPVWFLAENPIVGYWVRKKGVQLLFWSGQSFESPGLEPEGKFKAAHAHYAQAADIDTKAIGRWLREAETKQWDYKNVVKRRGVLVKIGDW